MATPQIIVSGINSDWPALAASTIRRAIDEMIIAKDMCVLMLAGGKTVEPVYGCWVKQQDFPHDRIKYFFGDERCVLPDHPDSNYGQAMMHLFPDGSPRNLRMHRIVAEKTDKDAAARQYESELPDSIDVLLLGMGEDGHVASLFPGDPALSENTRKVLPVIAPKPPQRRLTITPVVINAAKYIFLMATGVVKGKVLARALNEPENTGILPVQLLMHATWILDNDAAMRLHDFQR